MQYAVKKKVMFSAEKGSVIWAEPNSKSSAKQFCQTEWSVGHYVDPLYIYKMFPKFKFVLDIWYGWLFHI